VDDVARSRRLLLGLGLGVSAVLAVAGAACGAQEASPVGISPPRATERGPRSSDDASAGTGDFRVRYGLVTRLSDRFLSLGHAERFDGVVWANEAARASWTGDLRADGGADFAEGAVFVEEAIDRATGDGGVAGLLAMEKRGSAWRFSAVEPDGQVLTDARTTACATCHHEAPHDFVFRTPPATQSSSAAASAAMTATAPTPVATAAATYDARSAGSAAAPSRR
jgi:hypothetical protein